MRKLIKKIQGTRNFARLVKDPNLLGDVFKLSDATDYHEALLRTARRLALHPKGARSLEARRRMRPVVLAELAQLPPGTLGREFADHMISRGLDPAAIPVLDGSDTAEFVRAHLYESHDVWHVVTGFDTDVAGELGLQGFYMAQIDGPLPPTLLSAGLLNAAFHANGEFDVRMRNITVGWRAGKRAEPLFGTDWDLLWERPLEEVRRMHGIDPHGVRPELELEASIMTGMGGREAFEASQSRAG
jgi:ubiquinone biosynthesis protein Coq4